MNATTSDQAVREVKDSSLTVVELCEDDIPGAKLNEPQKSHNVSALKRWLLCHGKSGLSLSPNLLRCR